METPKKIDPFLFALGVVFSLLSLVMLIASSMSLTEVLCLFIIGLQYCILAKP